MKPIVLHIGSTKTGTSSLQRYLADQAADLLDDGVCYPIVGRQAAGRLAHHNLCYEKQDHRVRSGVFRPEVGTWEGALAEVDLSAATVGIVSSEAFMNCRPKQVARFRNELSDRDVSIVAYVRRQDRWMQSAWNQQARFGRCSLDFWEFYAQVRERGRGDYHEMLLPWAEAFGAEHVHVRNFDSLPSGGIVQDFFGTFVPEVAVQGPSESPARANTMAGSIHLLAVSMVVEECRAQLGESFELAASSAIRIAEFFRSRPGRDARFSVLAYDDAVRVYSDFLQSNERLGLMSDEFASSGGFPKPRSAEYEDFVKVDSLDAGVLDDEEERFVRRMTREIVRAHRSDGKSSTGGGLRRRLLRRNG